MANYLVLNAAGAADSKSFMLSEDEGPQEVGERIASALRADEIVRVRWVPADQLDSADLWVNTAQLAFWHVVQHSDAPEGS